MKLYVPVYLGELGWEIINYIPHINYVCRRKKPKEVHIIGRKGREGLYPMGTHFYPLAIDDSHSSGNTGGKVKNSTKLKKHQKKIGKYDMQLSSPGSGMRYYKKRKFLKYEPGESPFKIPPNSVVLSIRGRAHYASIKNWAPEKWNHLCEFLIERGYTPVLTGLREKVSVTPPSGSIDLMGKTNLMDLISIFHQSKFVVGQSTGPAHLASLCGVPHAVWGPDRIKVRYIKTWNPHGTDVVYHKCGQAFNCSLKDAFDLIKRLEEKLS